MSDTIISNLIINEMTEAEKSITTFGANQLIMTPDDTITSKIIDLGSYQYTYEGYVLPAIDVDVLRTIYANDKAGIYQTLVWSIYGNDNQFKVVCSDEISGTYSIDILVHNKYHCAYEWTSETTGNVNPIVKPEGSKFTTLWVNPNPNSNFNSQTIILNSSDYDYLIVLFNNWVGSLPSDPPRSQQQIIIPKGQSGGMTTTDVQQDPICVSTWIRNIIRVNDLSYTISDCTYKRLTSWSSLNTSTLNNSMIPIYILGVKL